MGHPPVAILVAAGAGRRMGADKLWIDFFGRPTWRWALDTLLTLPQLELVALVVPEGAIDRFSAALPESGQGRCLNLPRDAAWWSSAGRSGSTRWWPAWPR